MILIPTFRSIYMGWSLISYSIQDFIENPALPSPH